MPATGAGTKRENYGKEVLNMNDQKPKMIDVSSCQTPDDSMLSLLPVDIGKIKDYHRSLGSALGVNALVSIAFFDGSFVVCSSSGEDRFDVAAEELQKTLVDSPQVKRS